MPNAVLLSHIPISEPAVDAQCQPTILLSLAWTGHLHLHPGALSPLPPQQFLRELTSHGRSWGAVGSSSESICPTQKLGGGWSLAQGCRDAASHGPCSQEDSLMGEKIFKTLLVACEHTSRSFSLFYISGTPKIPDKLKVQNN